MRKAILLLFMGTVLRASLHAQTQPGFSSGYLSHSFEIFDASGKSFTNPPADDVAGSPYLTEVWQEGSILTSTGKQYDHVWLRLNLKSQEMHFLDPHKTEMVTPAGMIKAIMLYDSAVNKTNSLFQCGFPAIDNRKTEDFYQVLSHGKVWLLHSRVKTISVDKDALSGEVKKEYVLYEDDYLFSGDKMLRVKKDRSFVLAHLEDKKDQVAAFIDAHHIKFKSPDDLKSIIDYYNGIP